VAQPVKSRGQRHQDRLDRHAPGRPVGRDLCGVLQRRYRIVVGGPGALRAEQGAGLGGVPAQSGKAILATDFFTVTLLNGATVYVLAIIGHASRRVRILGVPPRQRWWPRWPGT